MKLSTLQAALGSVLLLSAPACQASSAHEHLHNLERKHSHLHGHKRGNGGTCAFPTDDPNMVAITPGASNKGWAMSPDQKCEYGMWCPFACKPGMVMNQWDPDSSYVYPTSMHGGLYCNKQGELETPFPNKPNCVDGTGTVKAINKCKSPLSWCQTILPGNEDIIIPTEVDTEVTIAVPGVDYWQSTASQ